MLAALCIAPLLAHDIASDVTIQAFVKPERQRLRVLMRVPMAGLRDIDYPHGGVGLVDLAKADKALHDAATLWVADNLSIYENDAPLPYPRVAAVRASLPSDQAFTSYDRALATVTGPALPVDTEFIWNQGALDVLFEYPIASDRSRLSIDPRFARLGIRVVTIVRLLQPDGAVRAFEFNGDPGVVRLDPRWYQAARTFVRLGFTHILDGIDHLLFLFCLVIPFRRFRSLVAVVTSFTVAHSITLIASAFDLGPSVLWFPPLIETLIAASIVYMALENIVISDASQALRRRWIITFAFGLVHGFGFSFALKQTLQFAGSHLLTSLLSFNVGVELGQLLVLVVLIPALALAFRYVMAERIGTIVLSALVAHTAWHWMTARWDALRRFTIEWPSPDTITLLGVVRLLMALVALAAAWWALTLVRRSKKPHPGQRDSYVAQGDRVRGAGL